MSPGGKRVVPEKHHAAVNHYIANNRDYGEGFYYCVLMDGGSYSYRGYFTVAAYPPSDWTMAPTFLHELGHSLGLMPSVFDGIDSDKYTFAEYPSIMKCSKVGDDTQPPMSDYLNYSSGGVFNDWAYLNQNGFRLHEYFYGY